MTDSEIDKRIEQIKEGFRETDAIACMLGFAMLSGLVIGWFLCKIGWIK